MIGITASLLRQLGRTTRIGIRNGIIYLAIVSLGLAILVWVFVGGGFHTASETSAQAFSAATSAYKAGRYDDAFSIMYPLAKGGDANAQFDVGFLYAWGRGVPSDRGKVLNWYRCAAEQGDGEAQLRVGIILMGKAVEQSLSEKRASIDPQLQSEGLAWLRRAAEQGHPEAQYDLGRQLLHQDTQAALGWFERAAMRDHDQAQFELGEIYREGKGSPAGSNYAEAAKWYLLAAERGNSAAQAHLGEMLYSAPTAPEDLVKASMWLNLAVAQSEHPPLRRYNKRLVELRDRAASHLTPEQKDAAQRLSSQWHPQHSTANSSVQWREQPAAKNGNRSAMPDGSARCELD